MAAGRIAFDGPPGAFLEWSIAADRDLSTPGARLFDRAGLRPLPVGVKAARETLAARALADPEPTASPPRTPPERPSVPR